LLITIKYEIEFLPAGNGEKSSDAILIRWEESKDNYKVMVEQKNLAKKL